MNEPATQKVFLSYHHDDQRWKDKFVKWFGDDIVDESVEYGDIDNENRTLEAILQEIREDYISDATVTVVLIGPCTWQRKYVDWEIVSSLRDTRSNPRCGLMGILLPNHPDARKGKYDPRRVPPRLADNVHGKDPYAKIYDWTSDGRTMRSWVDEAFARQEGTPPNNGRRRFRNNRSGNCAKGWPDKFVQAFEPRTLFRVS